MASSNIARLGVILALDTALFTAAVQEAINTSTKLKSSIARESKAAEKEIQALKYAIEDYGKEVSKVTILERELENGRFKSIKGTQLAADLLAQARAYDQIATSQKKAATTGLTDQQRLALTYQTTDLITQLASGQNAMIALLQQGGQLKDQMGGIGPMFAAIGKALTPTVLTMTAAATAVGILGAAFYQGSKQAAEFRDQLILTNNYANLTQKSFANLAQTLSQETNISIGNAKDIFMELIKSGSATDKSISSVAKSIALVSKLSGETATEVSQKLIPSFYGGADSIKSLNDKMGFLSLEQYKQIELLDKQGKKQEAAQIAADALTKSLSGQTREVSVLSELYTKFTNLLSDAFNWMKKIGDLPDTSIQLKQINDLIEAQEKLLEGVNKESAGGKIFVTELENLKARRQALLDQMKKEEDQRKQGEAGKKEIDDYKKNYQKRVDINNEAAKIELQNKIELKKREATEIGKLELDAQEKIAILRLDVDKKNALEGGVFAKENARKLAADELKILQDLDKAIADVRIKRNAAEYNAFEQLREETDKDRAEAVKAYQDQITSINKKIDAENISLDNKKQELYLQQSMLNMSEAEQKILLIDLKYQQQIAEIKRTLPDNSDRENIIERLTKQSDMEKALANTAEQFRKIKEISDSVWNNLSNALETFVRTGKLSFKDLARSIIQDLILIQIKAQALTIFNFLKGALFPSLSGAATSGGIVGPGLKVSGLRANGGPVSGGSAYLVGERGPELFMPSSAGTIIPNSQMGGGVTNVTNNYINAIDTKSFEDRILGSSSAIWAANAYAQKSLAVGRGRA